MRSAIKSIDSTFFFFPFCGSAIWSDETCPTSFRANGGERENPNREGRKLRRWRAERPMHAHLKNGSAERMLRNYINPSVVSASSVGQSRAVLAAMIYAARSPQCVRGRRFSAERFRPSERAGDDGRDSKLNRQLIANSDTVVIGWHFNLRIKSATEAGPIVLGRRAHIETLRAMKYAAKRFA